MSMYYPLTNEQLQRKAPSIFALEPHESRSEKYVYIPTIRLVDKLRNEGFFPFAASQSKSQKIGTRFHTKHLIRFRQAQDINNYEDDVNEIILINSHNGSCSYQMLSGAFRFACANGLIVGTKDQEIRVRHQGTIEDDVIEGVYRIVEQFEEVSEQKEILKSITLSDTQKHMFAETALEHRYEDKYCPLTPEKLLHLRRADDNKNDLWTVFNVVQENLIKGGLWGKNENNRYVKTRAVKGIDSTVKLNKYLWYLTLTTKDIMLS